MVAETRERTPQKERASAMASPAILAKVVSNPLTNAARRIKLEARVLRHARFHQQCPICGARFRFVLVDNRGDRHAMLCLRCKSLERHRRTILLLRQTELYTAKRPLRVLHVAPEPCLRPSIQSIAGIEYITGDLLEDDVDVKLDLTDMGFSDRSFDVIICSHVLEHVPDDVRAMREMRRVLASDGWALINVPADPELTASREDAAITDPQERLAEFGQEDHVRVYSQRDFIDRLTRAGFDVSVDPVEFTTEQRRRHLLDGDAGWDRSYLCRPALAN